MPYTEAGIFREPDNDDRATFALAAVEAFARLTRVIDADEEMPPLIVDEDREDWWFEVIGDLLADMQHLADKVGVDWDAVGDRGERHHDEEAAEEN